jgi:hypothetical protein
VFFGGSAIREFTKDLRLRSVWTMSNIDLENDVRQIVAFPDTSASGTEGVDAILAPIFKDVLEHEAGRGFTDRLDSFSVEKVAEIERMCNSNHQEFVGAVEKLLKARKGAAGLRLESTRVERGAYGSD